MEGTHSPKCILWGGYGGGNVGDELALAIALRDVSERYGSSEVAVLSPCPGYTKALFPESEVIPYLPAIAPTRNTQLVRVLQFLKRGCRIRKNQYEVKVQFSYKTSSRWAEAIKGCKLLYLVGGGYLTDLFDFESVILPVEVAQCHGIDVESAPVGVGPFNFARNAIKLQGALHEARILVRDVDSQITCKDLSITAELQQDDGFRVQEIVGFDSPVAVDECPIGINFYVQDGGPKAETVVKWWRDVLILLKSSGLSVEGFCFHNSLQSDFSQTVQLFVDAGVPIELVRTPDFDFRDACRRIAKYRAVLTARFHAAIVAGVAGIPVVAVADGQYYRSKMVSACQANPTSQVVDVSVTEPTEILQALRQVALRDTHT